MDYSEKKINLNEIYEVNDNSSSSFWNNIIEDENYFNSCSIEITGLNYFSPNMETYSNLQNNQPIIIKIPDQIVDKKKLGRKKKGSGEVGDHNEYCEDNLIRKSKKVFRDAILKFINTKIEKLEFHLSITIDNIKYKVKKLLNLAQTQTKESSVEENKALFQSPVKEILYEISGKYKKPANYNRIVIEEICKNPNEKCQKIAEILNLDYLDCFKYYRKDKDPLNEKNLDCLKGMQKQFDDLHNILKKERKEKYEESYEKALIYVIKNIDKIYDGKTSRERRK